jgi:hypothetical protein
MSLLFLPITLDLKTGERANKKGALKSSFFVRVHVLVLFYARVILSERRQRVHTFTFLVSPSTTARTL